MKIDKNHIISTEIFVAPAQPSGESNNRTGFECRIFIAWRHPNEEARVRLQYIAEYRHEDTAERLELWGILRALEKAAPNAPLIIYVASKTNYNALRYPGPDVPNSDVIDRISQAVKDYDCRIEQKFIPFAPLKEFLLDEKAMQRIGGEDLNHWQAVHERKTFAGTRITEPLLNDLPLF